MVAAANSRCQLVERDALLRQQHLLRREDAPHPQVELEVAPQALALRGQLVEQHAADGTRADHADRDRVRREIEARVHRAQRPRRGLARDDHRDVALGGALRDGANVDRGAAEGAEHLAGDAGNAGHAVTDHREDREVRVELDRLDLALLELARERRADHRRGPRRLLERHRAADRMLGTTLGDQDHRHALLAQRAEQAVRRAGHADHAGALEVDQGDVLDCRDALDRELGVRPRADQRRGVLGREGVADPDRDLPAHGRRHGLRMDDLGAEVRQLHRLAVGQRVDHLGIGHAPRIGRQHAVDVGPDVDRRGIEQRAEDRRGEVAAIAAERGLHAAAIGSDEAGDHQGSVVVGRDQALQALARLRPLHGRPERTPLDHHDLARVHPAHLARTTGRSLEEFAEQPGGPDLAVAGDQVDHVARRRAGQLHRVQDALEIVAVTVECGQVEPGGFGGQQVLGDRRMAGPQALQPPPVDRILRLGLRDQAEQRVRHPLAGGQHHPEPALRLGLEDRGNAAEAVGIGNAGAAELVNDPGGW